MRLLKYSRTSLTSRPINLNTAFTSSRVLELLSPLKGRRGKGIGLKILYFFFGGMCRRALWILTLQSWPNRMSASLPLYAHPSWQCWVSGVKDLLPIFCSQRTWTLFKGSKGKDLYQAITVTVHCGFLAFRVKHEREQREVFQPFFPQDGSFEQNWLVISDTTFGPCRVRIALFRFEIHQFRYIKFHPKTIELSTRLRGITWVWGVYFPGLRNEVYCLTLNFYITKLVY